MYVSTLYVHTSFIQLSFAKDLRVYALVPRDDSCLPLTVKFRALRTITLHVMYTVLNTHTLTPTRMQFPLFLVGRYYLSHALSIQLASIHIDSISTSSTVPGQMVMSVLRTNRVLKVIRLSAPMLRDDASEKRRLCSSRTRQTRYNRRNIGRDRMRSTGTSADVTV